MEGDGRRWRDGGRWKEREREREGDGKRERERERGRRWRERKGGRWREMEREGGRWRDGGRWKNFGDLNRSVKNKVWTEDGEIFKFQRGEIGIGRGLHRNI